MAVNVRNIVSLNWQAQIVHLKKKWDRWNINYTTRKELLFMDEKQLRDIGVDSIDAYREGRKYFWQR